MPSLTEQVAALMRRFDRQNDVEALKDAARLVESANAAATLPQDKLRRVRLENWLTIFNNIDEHFDRTFDFSDTPALTISPPPGLPSGVDPAEIKDPAAKRAYEQAIRDNQEKARRYAFQKNLKKINTDILERFRSFLSSEYRRPDDVPELTRALDKSVNNDQRRAELQQIVLTF